MRDSKNPTSSVLVLPLPAWAAFTADLRADKFR